jgi:hypothetical protein
MHLINDVRPKIFVILSLGIGGKLQYKIIVIVSLFMKLIFRLNCSQKCRMQEIAFLSLRKSKIFWGSMPPDPPSRSVSVNQKSYIPVTSASAELSFSKPKSVKTVMRSVMNQERLG